MHVHIHIKHMCRGPEWAYDKRANQERSATDFSSFGSRSRIDVCVCLYVCILTYTNMCMCMYTYMYLLSYRFLFFWVDKQSRRMCVCLYVRMYTHIQKYVYVYVYVLIYMCIWLGRKEKGNMPINWFFKMLISLFYFFRSNHT